MYWLLGSSLKAIMPFSVRKQSTHLFADTVDVYVDIRCMLHTLSLCGWYMTCCDLWRPHRSSKTAIYGSFQEKLRRCTSFFDITITIYITCTLPLYYAHDKSQELCSQYTTHSQLLVEPMHIQLHMYTYYNIMILILNSGPEAFQKFVNRFQEHDVQSWCGCWSSWFYTVSCVTTLVGAYKNVHPLTTTWMWDRKYLQLWISSLAHIRSSCSLMTYQQQNPRLSAVWASQPSLLCSVTSLPVNLWQINHKELEEQCWHRSYIHNSTHTSRPPKSNWGRKQTRNFWYFLRIYM